jgi:hypothetical protein
MFGELKLRLEEHGVTLAKKDQKPAKSDFNIFNSCPQGEQRKKTIPLN